MTNLKLSTAAAAILMATTAPAFAQSLAEGTIALTFEGDDQVYAVPFETAAELCDVSPNYFAQLATNPETRVIYCEDIDDNEFATFIDDGTAVPVSDFEDADDDDDDGDQGDDAEETAVDEANDAADDDDDDVDDAFDEDDEDVEDEDGLIDDDSADGDDDTMQENMDDDTNDDTE